jgi:hypothetical protein
MLKEVFDKLSKKAKTEIFDNWCEAKRKEGYL